MDGHQLIEWGFKPGPVFGKALSMARTLEAEGRSPEEIRPMLHSAFPPEEKIELRPADPSRLGVALEPVDELSRDNLEKVHSQMLGLTRIPVVERAAIMPDACPTGQEPTAITVGGAIAVRNALIPAAHSADICCSMYCSIFPETEQETSNVMDALQASTRFGMGGRTKDAWIHHPVLEEKVWRNPFLAQLQYAAAAHLGDQGDGNHFAYYGHVAIPREGWQTLREAGYTELTRAVEPDRPYGVLVTHHGSRALGAKVYQRGQRAALTHCKRVAKNVPPTAAWLDADSEVGHDYWEALQYVARWTRANHEVIHRGFLERLGLTGPVHAFGNEHNFVWKRDDGLFYHGKGATPAWLDRKGRPLLGLIPLNMSSPILLAVGGNREEFLGFAPHGAGRNRSRRDVMRDFGDLSGRQRARAISSAVERATAGLEVRWWYGKPDLTETARGYKDPETVTTQIEQFGLATICARIEPRGCIMAGDPGPAPWKRRKDQPSPKQLRQKAHRAERRKARQIDWEESGDL